MVVIEILGTEATCQQQVWECKDKRLQKILDTFTLKPEEGQHYFPDEDHALAEQVIKELGLGKIIRTDDVDQSNPDGVE